MVRPGDPLELEAIVRAFREEGGQASGVARVDGEIAAEAELTFAFAAVTNPRVAARRAEYLRVWLTEARRTFDPGGEEETGYGLRATGYGLRAMSGSGHGP
jgi:hypothetical protein